MTTEIENHTPGPWVVRQFPTGPNARGQLWVMDAIPDHDGKVVANAICSMAGTNEDAAANAQLIAAAPRLLAETCRLSALAPRLRLEAIKATETLGHLRDEATSVLQLMDGLAEQWGDEAVFRRCRDRLRAAVESTGGEGG